MTKMYNFMLSLSTPSTGHLSAVLVKIREFEITMSLTQSQNFMLFLLISRTDYSVVLVETLIFSSYDVFDTKAKFHMVPSYTKNWLPKA